MEEHHGIGWESESLDVFHGRASPMTVARARSHFCFVRRKSDDKSDKAKDRCVVLGDGGEETMSSQETDENMGESAEDAISIPESTPASIEESSEGSPLLPTGDPDDLDEEREILVVDEMERIKEDLMADADEWSEEECWRMHVEGSLDFPFQAVTPIRKRDGSTETHILDVIGPAVSDTGVMGEYALVLVDFKGVLMVYNIYDLEPIDMSDDMLSALQVWQYSRTGDWTIFNIDP
jgi:Calcium binding